MRLLMRQTISVSHILKKLCAYITYLVTFKPLNLFFHSVASLVMLAGYEGDDKPSFATVLRGQIKTLRKQLDKSTEKYESKSRHDASPTKVPRRPTRPSNERDVHALLDALSDSIRPNRIFDTGRYSQESAVRNDRDVRILLDEISDSLGRSEISSMRTLYEALAPDPQADGRDPRAPGDYLSSQRVTDQRMRQPDQMGDHILHNVGTIGNFNPHGQHLAGLSRLYAPN